MGNAQQVQNVGIAFISLFSCVRLKEGSPSTILEIQPPSTLDGLTENADGNYVIDVAGFDVTVSGQEQAAMAHKLLHAPWSEGENFVGFREGSKQGM